MKNIISLLLCGICLVPASNAMEDLKLSSNYNCYNANTYNFTGNLKPISESIYGEQINKYKNNNKKTKWKSIYDVKQHAKIRNGFDTIIAKINKHGINTIQEEIKEKNITKPINYNTKTLNNNKKSLYLNNNNIFNNQEDPKEEDPKEENSIKLINIDNDNNIHVKEINLNNQIEKLHEIRLKISEGLNDADTGLDNIIKKNENMIKGNSSIRNIFNSAENEMNKCKESLKNISNIFNQPNSINNKKSIQNGIKNIMNRLDILSNNSTQLSNILNQNESKIQEDNKQSNMVTKEIQKDNKQSSVMSKEDIKITNINKENKINTGNEEKDNINIINESNKDIKINNNEIKDKEVNNINNTIEKKKKKKRKKKKNSNIMGSTNNLNKYETNAEQSAIQITNDFMQNGISNGLEIIGTTLNSDKFKFLGNIHKQIMSKSTEEIKKRFNINTNTLDQYKNFFKQLTKNMLIKIPSGEFQINFDYMFETAPKIIEKIYKILKPDSNIKTEFISEDILIEDITSEKDLQGNNLLKIIANLASVFVDWSTYTNMLRKNKAIDVLFGLQVNNVQELLINSYKKFKVIHDLFDIKI